MSGAPDRVRAVPRGALAPRAAGAEPVRCSYGGADCQSVRQAGACCAARAATLPSRVDASAHWPLALQRDIYDDADGARKEEIAALGGGENVFRHARACTVQHLRKTCAVC